MGTKGKIKKEVSCKVLRAYFLLAEQKGIGLDKLLAGVPYSKSYLSKRNERIEWNVFCKINYNLRPFVSPVEFEEVVKDQVKKGFYPEGIIAGFIFFSSNRFSKMLTKRIIRMGQHMFSCIQSKVEHIDKNHIRFTACIADEYDFLPEFAFLARGTWLYSGKLIGHKEFQVNHTWIRQGVIFNISWKREGFIFKFKRGLRWLLSVRKAYLDLTDSHEELLNQYNKLEESKVLLQRQTAQLRTAHEITKSIRQSLDIRKTLTAITNALVNYAGFSSAHIKLFKDSEGNNFEIEALSGMDEKNVSHINKSIIIDNENIGELIIYPKIGAAISEIEEMLNYLLPIINISIHDSLVLRTVTDYKNNLEAKVEKRTTELKRAQDKLSETINLLQDAQQAQNRFFTNISHEFRTPLTLILGPVKQIIKRTREEKTRKELKVVHKNAKSLLELVNELLDISKLESGNMKLQAGPQNIIPLLKTLLQSFCSYAERKKINMKFNSSEDEITAYIDKEKFEKVITNLLSNAFKFTPEGGQIEVSVKSISQSLPTEGVFRSKTNKLQSFKNVLSPPLQGRGVGYFSSFLEISIRDTGIGIPKEKISKVFDRFYQVDGSHTRAQEGTGIGLSLTKELVELQKGKIEVVSKEGKGTIFTISIPLGKEHLRPEEICEAEKDETRSVYQKPIYIDEDEIIMIAGKIGKPDLDLASDASTNKKEKPILLIVEDNSDVRNYIKNNLDKNYKILEAADGEDGRDKSVKYIPDLIISDVMMPKMDGFKLCEKLKTDERTSHIPVILLTAKASTQDKIEGLETGADEYLIKPFETEELKARIKNLIEQRKRLHDYFRKHGVIELEESKITSIDKKFMRDIFNTITKNISNPSFNVKTLSATLSVSYPVLHKKIASLTGEPPVELIRRVRLNKAAELIKNRFGNVNEIALEVGFNNPAYFSECFKKQFEVPPSHYLQTYSQLDNSI